MIKTVDILAKVDWSVLNTYIENNLIVSNKHPEYDIWILNYSPKVQAQKLWDDYTMACRGLVVDAAGNILARPFKKFKNFEEYSVEEIPSDQEFEVFEKMDGSLIVIFYYKEYKEWIIASRGSFISEQAVEAKKMFNLNLFHLMKKKCTYLFEVIYPENRIVVDYGSLRGLVLLTRVANDTGYEPHYDELVKYYSDHFEITPKLNVDKLKNFADLRELEEDNKEGFVIRFANGFRMKVKFAEYIRLHAIVTNVSNLTVWEHLKNGYDFDELIDRVPDEFYNWVRATIAKLKGEFRYVELDAYKTFFNIFYVNGIVDRKEFASAVDEYKHKSILFKLYDKRPYDEIIWKKIRPEHSKPFKDGYVIY
jgi:RNA ligase